MNLLEELIEESLLVFVSLSGFIVNVMDGNRFGGVGGVFFNFFLCFVSSVVFFFVVFGNDLLEL